MEPFLAAGLPHYRAILALDIERSTSRSNPVKAELRSKTYELFEAALRKAGISTRHRDRFTTGVTASWPSFTRLTRYPRRSC